MYAIVLGRVGERMDQASAAGLAGPSANSGLKTVLVRLALALLAFMTFMAPAAINRSPILYPDTIGYVHSGKAVFREIAAVFEERGGQPQSIRSHQSKLKTEAGDGVSVSRSPFYGALLVALLWLGGAWVAIAAFCVVTIVCIYLALPHLGIRSPTTRLALIAGLGAISGVGVFTSTLMPDIFGGLAILGAAIVLGSGDSLDRRHALLWLLIVLTACLFHKAFVVTLMAMVVVGAIGWLMAGRKEAGARPIGAMAAVCVIAMTGHAMVTHVANSMSNGMVIEHPFLLARLIGDGPAERYLRDECPQRDFALCDHLDRMPMTENEFLWGEGERGLFKVATIETKKRILEESPELLFGTVTRYPLEVAQRGLHNFAGQLLHVGGREYARQFTFPENDAEELGGVLRTHAASSIAEGTMPMAAISFVATVVYVIGSLLAAIFAARLVSTSAAARDTVVSVVRYLILGVIANAAVNGMVAGVFDRYQGRVAWIMALVALAIVASRHAQPGSFLKTMKRDRV